MKILYCANIYETGIVGPARFAEMLLKINDLHRGRHEVRILTADVRREALPVYKMNCAYPRLFRFLDVWIRGLAFYRGIRRVRREFSYDLVLFGNATYGIVTKFFLKKTPIVGMVNDDHTLTVKCKDVGSIEGGLFLFLYSFVEKFSTFKLDLILACSDYLRNLLLETYGCPPQKVVRLYQGVDVKGISFKPLQPDASGVVKVLFVKFRHDLGRLGDLALALGTLADFSFRLTVLGPLPKDKPVVESYFAGIKNVGLEFIGAAPQSVVHEKMSSHDILCIPACLEAQGLANVEGLAHGISVVTTRAGGIPEVMDDGKNGWLCEPCNPGSLAAALRACIEAPQEERDAKSRNGRQFAEENFHYPKMLDGLLAILEQEMNVFYKWRSQNAS